MKKQGKQLIVLFLVILALAIVFKPDDSFSLVDESHVLIESIKINPAMEADTYYYIPVTIITTENVGRWTGLDNDLKIECGIYSVADVKNMGYARTRPGGSLFAIVLPRWTTKHIDNCVSAEQNVDSKKIVDVASTALMTGEWRDNPLTTTMKILTPDKIGGNYAFLCSVFENCWSESTQDIKQHDYRIIYPISIEEKITCRNNACDAGETVITCPLDCEIKANAMPNGEPCRKGPEGEYFTNPDESDNAFATGWCKSGWCKPKWGVGGNFWVCSKRDADDDDDVPEVAKKLSIPWNKLMDSTKTQLDSSSCQLHSECKDGSCVPVSQIDDEIDGFKSRYSGFFGGVGDWLFGEDSGICTVREEKTTILDWIKDNFGVTDDATASIILGVMFLGGLVAGMYLVSMLTKPQAPARRF